MLETKQIEALVSQAHTLATHLDLPTTTTKLEQLQEQTLASDFWGRGDAQDVMRQLGDLQATIQQAATLKATLDEVEAAQFVIAEEGDQPEYTKQLQQAAKQLQSQVKQLELEQYLDGKYDHLPAIFSVHAGQGGTEAMDWASMLARAYTRYFELHDWKCQLISESRGEEAGIKAISYEVTGKFAYGLLKNEAGTHRLVRLSPFNADSLRQTSFALVEVLPLIEDSDQDINLASDDLSWHFSRAGGAGGQNVNKVNTAVELTYLPLNLTVKCREERSQEQNKGRALQLLKGKLALMKAQQQAQELKDLKGDKTMASWGTQIRNYVLHPYQLVKDTRTGIETSDTTGVLDGKLDLFIQGNLALLSTSIK